MLNLYARLVTAWNLGEVFKLGFLTLRQFKHARATISNEVFYCAPKAIDRVRLENAVREILNLKGD